MVRRSDRPSVDGRSWLSSQIITPAAPAHGILDFTLYRRLTVVVDSTRAGHIDRILTGGVAVGLDDLAVRPRTGTGSREARPEAVPVEGQANEQLVCRDTPVPEVPEISNGLFVTGMRSGSGRVPETGFVVRHDVDEIELPQGAVGDAGLCLPPGKGSGHQLLPAMQSSAQLADEAGVIGVDEIVLDVNVHPRKPKAGIRGQRNDLRDEGRPVGRLDQVLQVRRGLPPPIAK